MQLAYLSIILYIFVILMFLLIPRKGFDNLFKRDMDNAFDTENNNFVYRGVNYRRAVIPGGGIVAGAPTFLLNVIFY